MPQGKKERQAQTELLASEFADKYRVLIQKHSENALSGKTDNYSTRFASGPSGYNDFIRIALDKLPENKRNKINDLDDLFHIHGTDFTAEAYREIHDQTEALEEIKPKVPVDKFGQPLSQERIKAKQDASLMLAKSKRFGILDIAYGFGLSFNKHEEEA